MMLHKKISIAVFLLGILLGCKQQEATQEQEETAEIQIQGLTDEELLEQVQKQTLKYFWDYAEPNSGMAKERFHPDGNYPKDDAHVVTTGGSGFGLMAIVVGMERGFIDRAEALARLNRIADFLATTERFHGAWPHWINGETGEPRSFSAKDNGGDIVETSFLAQGFIVVREYLKGGTEEEKNLAQKYDDLWQGIEWDWYTNDQEGLIWHWSKEFGFEKNFLIEGYNECLITYVMAASSPNHAIEASAYHEGWARGGDIVSEQTAYGLPLVLKHNTVGDKGGPLFWAHYSHLGLNPKGLSDRYADYWELNRNHSLINYNYSVENPEGYETYSEESWGLTASYTRNEDDGIGYTAHAPDNDRGVVSPTAAVSSLPYTPEESLRAIRYFYQDQHELLWGPAGFYDAFSLEGEPWVAPYYLAIDQGPMVVMIENYRSGLIWDLFMGAPEIQKGLEKLDFTVEENKNKDSANKVAQDRKTQLGKQSMVSAM